jgi:hypothetical protein
MSNVLIPFTGEMFPVERAAPEADPQVMGSYDDPRISYLVVASLSKTLPVRPAQEAAPTSELSDQVILAELDGPVRSRLAGYDVNHADAISEIKQSAPKKTAEAFKRWGSSIISLTKHNAAMLVEQRPRWSGGSGRRQRERLRLQMEREEAQKQKKADEAADEADEAEQGKKKKRAKNRSSLDTE